eukprot:scaffold34597_cov24-Tisochrysis_lutea.AAC.1
MEAHRRQTVSAAAVEAVAASLEALLTSAEDGQHIPPMLMDEIQKIGHACSSGGTFAHNSVLYWCDAALCTERGILCTCIKVWLGATVYWHNCYFNSGCCNVVPFPASPSMCVTSSPISSPCQTPIQGPLSERLSAFHKGMRQNKWERTGTNGTKF